MKKFELNEIAYYEQDDYTFAPCFCLIVGVSETYSYYYILPLNAQYIMASLRAIPDNGFFAAPGALRKVAQPVIVAQDDPTPESEPEGVAPEDEPESQDIPQPDELTKLRNAFTLMRDMVDPNRDSRTDKYLFCPSGAGGTSPCNACPFDMEETCGVEQMRKLLLCMKGASDSSL